MSVWSNKNSLRRKMTMKTKQVQEPTNHLDIPAREAVEQALMSFPGTFLVVSHDRYFLDKVTNFTYELANHHLTAYEGNYSYYRGRKLAEIAENEKTAREEQEKIAKNSVKVAKKMTVSPSQHGKQREKMANEYGKAREEKILRCEAEIAMLEAELKGLEFTMNDLATQADPQKSQEVASLYAAKELEIENKYKEWATMLSK